MPNDPGTNIITGEFPAAAPVLFVDAGPAENLRPLDDDRVGGLLKDPTTHVFIRDLKGTEDGVDEAFADVCRGASVNWSTLKAETQQSGRAKSRPIDPDWRNRADLATSEGHPRQRLVPAAVPDQAVTTASGGTEV
jgi:hypothetical protein